jgi:hypothetical protein
LVECVRTTPFERNGCCLISEQEQQGEMTKQIIACACASFFMLVILHITNVGGTWYG